MEQRTGFQLRTEKGCLRVAHMEAVQNLLIDVYPGGKTTPQIMQALSLSENVVWKTLQDLRTEKAIHVLGFTPNNGRKAYTIWGLTEAGVDMDFFYPSGQREASALRQTEEAVAKLRLYPGNPFAALLASQL